jgi:8-oxo-dGTP pyrophosphatase MutT (NUDIX family)
MSDKKIVQRVVIGGVIFNKEKKVLILQRSKDEDIFPEMWELPSGKREFLENSESCLMREMKEETGLSNFKIIMPFYVFEYQIEKPEEIRDTTQINFLLKLLGDEKIKLSSEHQNFAWISRGSIKNQQLSRPVKKVILKAFELMEKFDLNDKIK